MRVVVTIIWAFHYILTSMAQTPFNMTQAITYTIFAILGVFLLDGILSAAERE